MSSVVEFHEDAGRLRQLLPFLLRASRAAPPATAPQCAGLAEYLADPRVRWLGWSQPGGWPAASLLVLLPGGAGLLLLTAPSRADEAVVACLQQALLAAQRLRLRYVEALIEPEDEDRRSLLIEGGVGALTELIYLQKSAAPAPPAAELAGVTWTTYDAKTQALFERAVEASYEGSLDFPELRSIRTTDEVLAAHQAAGPFDPDLWHLALVDGQPAGCVLLSRVAGAQAALLELVYLGVAPGARRSGLGGALVQRAVQCAHAAGAARLITACDRRNAPALGLYARCGLRRYARRCVHLWLAST